MKNKINCKFTCVGVLNNPQAFTLIELLAVIIILAIVVIIATPMVLDVVSDAKLSANKSTAYNIIDAGRLYYTEGMFNNDKANDAKNLNNIYDNIVLSGKKPKDGKLYVNTYGNVALAVIMDNKCYKKELIGNLSIQDLKDIDKCEVDYLGYDLVSPTLELVINKETNENGWATNDVTIDIIVTDNDSKPASYKFCKDSIECDPTINDYILDDSIIINDNKLTSTQSINEDTNGTILCVIGYDKAGRPSDKKCTDIVKLDKTEPTVGDFKITGTLGSNDWYISDVSIEAINGSDNLSKITNTLDISSITSNTTGTLVTLTTVDEAGNTSIITKTIMIDKNSPTISAKTGSVEVFQGYSYSSSSYFDTGYSVSGGNVSCTPTNTSSLSIGNHTLSCTITGNNGLSASASKSISVVEYYQTTSFSLSGTSSPMCGTFTLNANKIVSITTNNGSVSQQRLSGNSLYVCTVPSYYYNSEEVITRYYCGDGATRLPGNMCERTEKQHTIAINNPYTTCEQKGYVFGWRDGSSSHCCAAGYTYNSSNGMYEKCERKVTYNAYTETYTKYYYRGTITVKYN